MYREKGCTRRGSVGIPPSNPLGWDGAAGRRVYVFQNLFTYYLFFRPGRLNAHLWARLKHFRRISRRPYPEITRRRMCRTICVLGCRFSLPSLSFGFEFVGRGGKKLFCLGPHTTHLHVGVWYKSKKQLQTGARIHVHMWVGEDKRKGMSAWRVSASGRNI